ncbi:hypothetical protein DCAR_0206653 [Daucus carota subsp. sativus]|uniref:Myosin motor domain-containing protein n=1 Tax=Daucus carota subsp. sativus TaxID=79200 RepID=A0AAF0WFZ3_DAUCS|nr:hypothetical protein DCAR_0206653 [Daucus carota subsp. sativus]
MESMGMQVILLVAQFQTIRVFIFFLYQGLSVVQGWSRKTETAKIAMQCWAALGGGSGIEYEILKTNPILEAFGDAKTSRNNNSIRFVIASIAARHFAGTKSTKLCEAQLQSFCLHGQDQKLRYLLNSWLERKMRMVLIFWSCRTLKKIDTAFKCISNV